MKFVFNTLSLIFVTLLCSYAFWTAFIVKIPDYENLESRVEDIRTLKFTSEKDGLLAKIKLFDSDETYSTPTLQKHEFDEIAARINSQSSVDLKYQKESNMFSYIIPNAKTLYTIYTIESDGTQYLTYDRSVEILEGKKSQAKAFFVFLLMIPVLIYFLRKNRPKHQFQPVTLKN